MYLKSAVGRLIYSHLWIYNTVEHNKNSPHQRKNFLWCWLNPAVAEIPHPYSPSVAPETIWSGNNPGGPSNSPGTR